MKLFNEFMGVLWTYLFMFFVMAAAVLFVMEDDMLALLVIPVVVVFRMITAREDK